MKKSSVLWIVAALSAAVLVPLYGDPRRSPVTHSEWARMIMRSVGFEDNLARLENAEDIFLTLAWKDQRNFSAFEYKRATGVTKRGQFVDAGREGGETAYDLPIIRSADYNLRLRLRGAPDKPFKVEIRRDGSVDAVETHRPTGSGTEYTTADLGWIRLEPGNHTISVGLPPGTSLESLQVSPSCLSPIEPENGWRASALTTDEDLARTMLQALEMERELPPADEPIEIRAGKFERLAPESAVNDTGKEATEDYELRATPEGLHAIVYADLPQSGLYAVSVWASEGGGQTWVADSCRRADVCPSGNLTPKWRHLLTSEFSAGRHSFTVLLANGSTVGRLRIQRLKTSPEDYVNALERVGFRVGPKGPISRAKAREAMEWLRDKRKQALAADPSCVVETPLGRVAGIAGQGAGVGSVNVTPVVPVVPVVPPPTGPPSQPPPPSLPPPLPPTPQPPATPVLPVR